MVGQNKGLKMIFKVNAKDIKENHSCFCSSTNIRDISNVYVNDLNIFSTSYCDDCGLVFRSRHPNLDWLSNSWHKRLSTQIKENTVFINDDIEKNRFERYTQIGEIITENFGLGAVLDIGCGTGFGSLALKQKGFEVTGLEPDGTRADIAIDTHGLNVTKSTIEDYVSNSSEKFDFIIMSHSLEHMMEPRLALEAVGALLKNTGKLYVEVPDLQNFVKDWNDALYMGHITNFNFNSLCTLAHICKLNPVLLIEASCERDDGPYLGVVFEKVSNTEGKPARLDQSLSYEKVAAQYTVNIEDFMGVFPVEINIPHVNDLSLLFKPTAEVKSSVNENTLNRRAVYNGSSGDVTVSMKISPIAPNAVKKRTKTCSVITKTKKLLNND
jgi:2-polyprenyl-3-methyl-5-hydroxy-6-metoxy-1,4-benzoquinol methylase